MACKGKCYLVKKLKEEQKNEAPISDSKKQMPEIPFFFVTPKLITASLIKEKVSSIFFSYNDLQTVSLSNSVFHPPSI